MGEVWAYILLGLTQAWLLYDLNSSLSYLVNNNEVHSSIAQRVAVFSLVFCVWTGLSIMFMFQSANGLPNVWWYTSLLFCSLLCALFLTLTFLTFQIYRKLTTMNITVQNLGFDFGPQIQGLLISCTVFDLSFLMRLVAENIFYQKFDSNSSAHLLLWGSIASAICIMIPVFAMLLLHLRNFNPKDQSTKQIHSNHYY